LLLPQRKKARNLSKFEYSKLVNEKEEKKSEEIKFAKSPKTLKSHKREKENRKEKESPSVL
jgi:hypothetical protein